MSWLYVLSNAPYSSARFNEAIDALLVAGVFEKPVRVLLIGDAVQALRGGQNAAPLGSKTAGKVITALPDYDIDEIYACSESVKRAGLQEPLIGLPVRFVDEAEQAMLIAESTVVLND